MSSWGKFASMFDLSGAWNVVRSPAMKGAFWDAMGAYFSGRNMAEFGAAVRTTAFTGQKAAAIAATQVPGDVLRAGVRIGGAAALGGGALYLGTRTDVGRKVAGVAMPLAAAGGVYAAARYGLNKVPKNMTGYGLASHPLHSRGLATLGGLGTFVGLRGGM